MNEEELKEKIYEILGLEFGSLSNEGGNDWIRAKKEALEEFRAKEHEKLKEIESFNYLTIDKNSKEFQFILNSKSYQTLNQKNLISQRNDLTEKEIILLISNGDKDTLINLSKFHKLSTNCIDLIIQNSTYLSKKYLIENQNLTLNQKSILKNSMTNSTLDYSDLLNKLNES